MAELTGDVGAVVEAAKDLGVNIYSMLRLVEELLVPGQLDCLSPVCKGPTYQGIE